MIPCRGATPGTYRISTKCQYSIGFVRENASPVSSVSRSKKKMRFRFRAKTIGKHCIPGRGASKNTFFRVTCFWIFSGTLFESMLPAGAGSYIHLMVSENVATNSGVCKNVWISSEMYSWTQINWTYASIIYELLGVRDSHQQLPEYSCFTASRIPPGRAAGRVLVREERERARWG